MLQKYDQININIKFNKTNSKFEISTMATISLDSLDHTTLVAKLTQAYREPVTKGFPVNRLLK